MKLQNVSKNNLSFKIGSYLVLIGIILALVQKGITTVKKVEPTPTQSLTEGETAIVSKVTDGDTIVLSTGEEVRYIGIDTPEIENNECFATEASKMNSELVLGKEVRLVKDVSETDKYGRLLRYVYVGNTLINDELIKVGAAKVMTIKPDIKFESDFATSEKFAHNNSLGLWGKCRE